uniref:BLE2 protein n=1 Tax=Leersia perrieri TaxID=77586 RepID=A0A0D9X297_9ORYZ
MSKQTEHVVVDVAAEEGTAASNCGYQRGEIWPEKQLNLFVRVVASVERAGNALGTLAFTWATVVLLGGYPTTINFTDFVFATALFFLEAVRMFSPNRSEYQLFFRTWGAFRPFTWNRVIVVICLNDVAVFLRNTISIEIRNSVVMLMRVAAILPFPVVHKLKCGPLHHAIVLWSPLAVMLLLIPTLFCDHARVATKGNFLIARIFYMISLVTVLLLRINKLQFPSITRLVHRPVINKLLSCHQVILVFCMCIAAVTLVFFSLELITMIVLALSTTVCGGLQIPAAVLRVDIALIRLLQQDYYGESDPANDSGKINLKPTLNVFYGMVLCQGILYLAARMLEFFSFFPRRSLARRGGFRGHQGVQSVDMYYTHAFEKCMKSSILAPKKMNLITFAMDSLKSGSRKEQLCGVRILYSLVHQEPYDKLVLSKVANSMKTVTTLIQMLGWTNQEDNQIRFLAAKITAELASGLRIIAVPGAMNFISSLLDNQNRQQIQELTIQIDSGDEQNCWIVERWCQMTKQWSILEEEQWGESDILPALGLVTLERLATYDYVNCVEISRSMDLIPKITGFTSNNSEKMCVNGTGQKVLIELSLRVLRRLASIGGETGITLRHKISEDPFLLGNLAEILEDNSSSQELKELTIDILIKLAMDESIRQEIGSIQVIVQKLMFAFIAQDGLPDAQSDCLMTIKAGQALSMLTLGSAENCSAIMKEPGHGFFKDLARMIHDNRYIYVAANVLQNMCKHSRVELGDSDLVELTSVLPEVLARVVDAEGKELEVLVGLSSQICSVSPEGFTKLLEESQNEAMFVKKLINALNANIKPNSQFPGIRRVIIEQFIYMMELSPRYATYFRNHGLMEALTGVEKTPSRAEKYRLFLGNEGLMEHRIAAASTGGRPADKVAAPEKWLNGFVRVVALIARVGNALGTLAFTWATVVLLGGYPTVLHPEDDFWFATTIVFLEATRMFSPDNRLDYQLFFGTRGAFMRLGWNGLLTRVLYLSVALVIRSRSHFNSKDQSLLAALLVDMVMLVAIGQMLSPRVLKLLCNPLRRAISLWSPLLPILLIGLCIPVQQRDYETQKNIPRNPKIRLIWYLLSLIVLLATISRMRLPCIVKLVDAILSRKRLAWRQIVLNFCMLTAIVMLVFTFIDIPRIAIIIFQLCALVAVSFGNFQIPAAVVRVLLALLRLGQLDYHADGDNIGEQGYLADGSTIGQQGNEKNLKPSLNIFYGMVLGQGILYILACLLEVFSFFPRRRLIRHGGFRGQLGVEYIDLYYGYAFEKCMGGPVLAPKKISLITFAMDSLNSDSSRNKLYGVQMLHSFLKKEQLRTKTITRLTNATKTVASLFDMLGWTSDEDADIRLFAAKVTAELAGSIRVVQIPGATQLVASLLENDHQQRIKNHFLFIDSQEGTKDSPIQQVGMVEQNSAVLNFLKKMAVYCLIPADEPSKMDGQNSYMLRCWKRVTKYWSIPEDETSRDQDFLPVEGLLILERLANFDPENCMEISRATGLISKMIEFTSYRNCITSTNEEHNIALTCLSLRVLKRLANTEGKLGVTLRHQILEHPFVLINIAEILSDSGSSQEQKHLAAEILRNLAMDKSTSEDIGHIRVIISSLMRAFLSRDQSSSTNSNHLLRQIAGQALAMLAMESTNNCLAMLMEPGYVFIKELTTMIHDGGFKWTAANLLWNICEHAQPGLSNFDLKELSYTLREVLEGIMDAEGAGLEVLIGLSSQICKAVPKDFAKELEHGQIKEKFVKRLVDVLNAYMRPSAHCPGIRRVIIHHSIYLMEFNSRYANDFHKCWMMEALSMVERTPSRAENYRLFSGDAGLMEHTTPLSTLVARAKELMGREWVPAPETQLNRFVHLVAITERVGNALGTLAFTWATVVLLGGYPTVLRPADDFWFATTIVFLEAARMFSRDNRLDYQLFFSTRGAFRLLGWNGLLTMIVYYSAVLVILSNYYYFVPDGSVMIPLLLDMVMLIALGKMLSPGALKLVHNPVRRAISLWSPLLGIILMGPCIPQPVYNSYHNFRSRRIILKNSMTRWILYFVLFFSVFLATISRLRFPCIVKLVSNVMSNEQLLWRRFILNLSMLAAIAMLVFTFSEIRHQVMMVVYQISALLVVSFGNFQIPAAVVRVVLALIRLLMQNYIEEGGNAGQDGCHEKPKAISKYILWDGDWEFSTLWPVFWRYFHSSQRDPSSSVGDLKASWE